MMESFLAASSFEYAFAHKVALNHAFFQKILVPGHADIDQARLIASFQI
jgi:hypothetical protein